MLSSSSSRSSFQSLLDHNEQPVMPPQSKKLIALCVAQATFLVLAICIVQGSEACPYSQDSFDCSSCHRQWVMGWKEATLLSVGLTVLISGILAAIKQHPGLCKFYGVILILHSAGMTLHGLVIAFGTPTLRSGAATITNDEQCSAIASTMMTFSICQTVLFGVAVLMDMIGAMYAIRAKTVFQRLHAEQRLNLSLQHVAYDAVGHSPPSQKRDIAEPSASQV